MDRTFEETLQQKLKTFSPAVSDSQWEVLSEKLDKPFESAIQSKVANFEPPVSAAIWASISASMPNSLESKISRQVDGFKATPPPGAWDAISGRMEEIPGNFEYTVQNKFQSFAPPPPSGTLEAIESRLDETRAKDAWKKVLIPALMIFAAIGLAVLSPSRISHNDLANFRPASTLTSGENTNIASSSIKAIDEMGLENPDLQNSEDGKSPTSIRHISSQQDQGHTTADRRLVATGSYPSNKGSNGLDHLTSSTAMSDQTLALIDPLQINDLPSPEGPVRLPSEMAYNEYPQSILTCEKTSSNSISVFATSGYFNILNRVRLQDIYDDGYLDFAKSVYSAGSFVSVGSDVQIGISNKKSITTGLSITSGNQNMEFSTYEEEVPSYSSLRDDNGVVTNYYNPNPQANLLNKRSTQTESTLSVVDQSEIRGDSIISGDKYHLSNSYLFVDVPLGMNFKVVDGKKSSLNIKGGAKLRLMAGANSFHFTRDRDRIVEVSPAISQTFYQSSIACFAGVDYSHSINENLEWFIGPDVTLNLSDVNRMGTWLSMRPFQMGVSVGVRQQLN